ncbi:MAG: 50S ribosomal protein L6 [Elusimicrobia bacterium]|nr:50S ribosomal protein L6 [Elusimicrobiota bacterium]
MSRVGKKPITVPDGIKVSIAGGEITVEGSGKKLAYVLPDGISAIQKEKDLILERKNDSPRMRSLHGLSRSLINNMIYGISKGFSKSLEMVGRGKRAKVQGKNLILELGFSHPVNFSIPDGIDIKVDKNIIEISGYEKSVVGQLAANIRGLQPPEPYKGSGIRYKDEVVKKKAGKAAVGGGFTGAGK